jgi:Ca-activated chloride channel homolog
VIATVTDRSGRFVAGLRQADFTVYDDNEAVEVTHFSNERVPVSFGIELVTSGSMAGDKIASARAAIDRFLDQLLNPDDEVFLLGFSSDITVIQGWTANRDSVSTSLERVRASGGTALYDAVLEAVPMAQAGRNH